MNYAPKQYYSAAPMASAARPLDESTMEKVCQLESILLQMEQVDCPVRNFFADGLYAREMSLPANTVITGAVHKKEHITIISKGRIKVVRPSGVEEIAAPAIFISQPGVKNAVHVLEDAVWTTFHANPTNEKDMDVLVPMLTTSKNSELLGNRNTLQGDKKCHLE